jgi:hypothetical protein
VRVFENQVSFDGTVHLQADLDLPDALDFEQAVRAGASRLAELGCPERLDARRALAVGEMARSQRALDLVISRPARSESAQSDLVSSRTRSATKAHQRVTLVVHLAESAITGRAAGAGDSAHVVARVENTQTLVTADQIRDWCGRPIPR